jgi:putative tryptophan/tyrosine transport system substrate-binding protein
MQGRLSRMDPRMRRREVLALLGGAVAFWPLVAAAEQRAMPVIGWLHSLSESRSAPVVAAFRQGLREIGYIEGQNIAIEYRWAEGHYDRLPELAADLVSRKVDVIVTGGGSTAALAAKNASSTIPIVFSIASDPVESGIVQNLARPEANITGVSIQSFELTEKRLEFITELVPHARVIGLLVNPKQPITEKIKSEVLKASVRNAVRIEIIEAASESELDIAFAELAQLRVEALVVGGDAFFYNQRDQIAALAARYALPASYELRGFVD